MTIKINENLLNFVRPSPHSTFSPSSTERWMACPYSINATRGIPEQTSIWAEEGTLAHSVCEALFAEEFYMIPFPNTLKMEMMKWETKTPGTYQEMMDCARQYVDCITYWLQNEDIVGKVLWYGLEKGVPIFPEDGCFGTADCLIIGEKASVIIDYKHGKGKNVSADSPQLKTYAAGIFVHITDMPEDYKFISVVSQPRTDICPKVAEFNITEISHHLNEISAAIDESEKPNQQPIEGNHCHWCPARRPKDPKQMCPVYAQKAISVAEEDFGKFLADMNASIAKVGDANPKRDAALIKVISLLPLMQQIAKDGMDEFLMRIEKGENIAGLRLIDKQGNREWIHDKDEDMSAVLRGMFPSIEAMKTVTKTSLKTITEIEKEVGKNKLDLLVKRKITKKLEIENSKIQEVLGDLSNFGNLINAGE